MPGIAKLLATSITLAVVSSATPALADMSACDSAFRANGADQQIALYTTCITKGGLPIQDRAGAYNNRGLAYARAGDTDKAFDDFTSAIESDPSWGTSYVNRGYIYSARGDWAKALGDFDKATRLSPVRDQLAAYRAEVRLLATSRDPALRDGGRAVQLALKALKMTETSQLRDLLAMAYAEAGRYDDAVREETKAIALAQSKHQAEDATEFQSRLELYRRGVPFRD